MPSGKRISERDRISILDLFAAGLSFREIASELGLHRTTVAVVVRCYVSIKRAREKADEEYFRLSEPD